MNLGLKFPCLKISYPLKNCHIWLNSSCLVGSKKHSIVAPRKIHTRAYPDPNPPEIVDNPERILRKSPKAISSTIVRSLHRANSVPDNLTAL